LNGGVAVNPEELEKASEASNGGVAANPEDCDNARVRRCTGDEENEPGPVNRPAAENSNDPLKSPDLRGVFDSANPPARSKPSDSGNTTEIERFTESVKLWEARKGGEECSA
jgi:hypothetical protein